MENDPRDKTHLLVFSERQGELTVRAGSIESVSRFGVAKLKVTLHGHMTVYVHNSPTLLPELLRSMANCAEYNDAADEVAAQTEARIQ